MSEKTLNTGETGDARQRRRRMQQVIVASVISDIAFWMLLPLIYLRLATQGVDPLTIGLMGAMPWLALFIAAPATPWLVCRLGSVAAIRVAICLPMVSLACFACSQNPYLWGMANGLLGLAYGLGWVVADCWVSSDAAPDQRGRWVGIYESFTSGAIGVGPVLLTVVGVAGEAPLLLAGALMGVALLLSIGLTNARGLSVQRIEIRDMTAVLDHSPAIALGAFLCGLLEEGAIVVLPIYGVNAGHGAESAALLVGALGLGNLAVQLPVGACCDRFGYAAVQRWGVVGLLAGLLVMLAADGIFLVLLAVIFVWGGLVGAFYTTAVVEAGGTLRGGGLVSAISVAMAMCTLGSIVGPVVGGLGMSLSPDYGLFIVFSITLAVVGFLLWHIRRREARRNGDMLNIPAGGIGKRKRRMGVHPEYWLRVSGWLSVCGFDGLLSESRQAYRSRGCWPTGDGVEI